MRLDRWVVLPYLLLAGLQGTALSALLTFSDRVVYAHYRSVPRLWNITALDDQAVAGALMWACGSLVYLVALSLVVVKIWNEPAEPQWAGNAGAGPLPRGLDAFGRGSRKRLARIRKLERRSERTTSPPAPRRWDLLQLPLLGTVMRSLTTRRVLQAGLFALAALIVIDGLLGPQVSPVNLAGVLPWIHWRGLLVIVLLVAGNFFCMACPFTLPRTIAKKIFRGNLQWPEFLRNKWLAIGLLILFFWAYEALALWDSPWWTAWIVVGYFAASFAIDGLFRGAAFCKYVCPIGQFNFVTSLVSPLQVAVRDISSCTTCETKDCIRGGPLGPGCQTDLFAPQKASNLDCTFCLDCVRSCPRDNVGLLAFVPTNQLTRAAQSDSSRQLLAGAAWWRRTDIAALLLVLASAAFVNAAWMVAPVVQLEQETMSYFVSAVRPLLVGLGMLVTLCGVPALAMFVCSASSRGLGGSRLDLLPIAKRYTPALVPLAVAMWAAHYAFHLLSSAGTLLAAGNRLLADWKLVPLSEAAAACACCGEAAGWILPLEILLLDVGLCGSLLVAYRVAQTDAASTAVALRAFAPWGVLLLGLFALGVWILLQPMQMRGTLVLGV
jgi:polyferredoxin